MTQNILNSNIYVQEQFLDEQRAAVLNLTIEPLISVDVEDSSKGCSYTYALTVLYENFFSMFVDNKIMQ